MSLGLLIGLSPRDTLMLPPGELAGLANLRAPREEDDA